MQDMYNFIFDFTNIKQFYIWLWHKVKYPFIYRWYIRYIKCSDINIHKIDKYKIYIWIYKTIWMSTYIKYVLIVYVIWSIFEFAWNSISWCSCSGGCRPGGRCSGWWGQKGVGLRWSPVSRSGRWFCGVRTWWKVIKLDIFDLGTFL